MEMLLLKRIFRIFGLAMVVVAVLAVALAGTVSAAGGVNPENGNGNLGLVCPYGDGECDCVCGDCVPNPYNHLGPGQWKAQTGK